jgi:hypothetical protein
MLSDNIHVCHRCPFRQEPCNGSCACTVDGRDIIDHAERGDCPHERFPQGYAQKPVEIVQKAAELTEGNGCGCSRASRPKN